MLFKKGEGGCLISHACVVQCEGRRSWRKRLTRNFGPTPSLVSPGAEFFLRPPPATTDGCLEKMKRKGWKGKIRYPSVRPGSGAKDKWEKEKKQTKYRILYKLASIANYSIYFYVRSNLSANRLKNTRYCQLSYSQKQQTPFFDQEFCE